MRSKVKRARTVATLERLLEALAEELAQASDEEVLAACADLGMNPQMRGSAAFIGLKYPSRPRLEEFFDLDAIQRMRLGATDRRQSSLQNSRHSPTVGPTRSDRPGKDDDAGDK
jgi:hypothetical protein